MNGVRWVMIVLAAAVVIGSAYWITTKPSSAGYFTLASEELQAKIDAGEKLVIVDLREPDLYQAGHIQGARNIPFEEFDRRINELNPEDNIVLVCHMGPMGDVSGSLLAQQGYAKVWNLAGGMSRWGGKLVR